MSRKSKTAWTHFQSTDQKNVYLAFNFEHCENCGCPVQASNPINFHESKLKLKSLGMIEWTGEPIGEIYLSEKLGGIGVCEKCYNDAERQDDPASTLEKLHADRNKLMKKIEDLNRQIDTIDEEIRKTETTALETEDWYQSLTMAHKELESLQSELGKYGAADTEGREAIFLTLRNTIRNGSIWIPASASAFGLYSVSMDCRAAVKRLRPAFRKLAKLAIQDRNATIEWADRYLGWDIR